jgi:hypothetical protein
MPRRPSSRIRPRPLSHRALLPLAIACLSSAATPCTAQPADPTTASAASVDTRDDAFLAGYVSAIIEREVQLEDARVEVRHGVVTITAWNIAGAQQDRIDSLLTTLPEVEAVEFRTPPPVDAAAEASGVAHAASGGRHPAVAPDVVSDRAVGGKTAERGVELLPSGYLFDALIADPKWTRAELAYLYYDDAELGNVGAATLGLRFPFARGPAPGGQWQVGLQGGIFAIFDLDAESSDLVNADYWVGLPLSYRSGDFSGILRVFHQSSHLGDEFLLRNRIDRVNLSVEGIDFKLSYEIGDVVRPYVGAGYLFRREPSDLAPWSTQVGVELYSPWSLAHRSIRPVFGTDVQHHEENDWHTDVSVRAGIRLESPRVVERNIQILLQYYDGKDPNGQFFERSIRYTGVGVQAQF